MAPIAGAEVVAPKAAGKVADQLEEAVAREMAVDGQVEQVVYLVEDVAMLHLAEGKIKFLASNSVE